MNRELFRNDFYFVEHDTTHGVLRVVRTATAQTADSIERSLTQIVDTTAALRGLPVLVDLRLAPGTNDPQFEQHAFSAMTRVYQVFNFNVVFLVQSAVGVLHMSRISRTAPMPLRVFSDEREALQALIERTASASSAQRTPAVKP